MNIIKNRSILITYIMLAAILLVSDCSITAERHFERKVSPYSICWQDDEHFLVYCSIEQYYYTPNFLAEDDIHYDWAGGEVWRVNALTGATELLIRDQNGIMYSSPIDDNRLSVRDSAIYYSNASITCKIESDFSKLEKIGDFILPVISHDCNELIVANLDNEIQRYNVSSNDVEDVYFANTIVCWLDYSFATNSLLINNKIYIDLSTGAQMILIQEGEYIEQYRVSDIYYTTPSFGQIFNDYITFDVSLRDTVSQEVSTLKLRAFIDDSFKLTTFNMLRGKLNQSLTLSVFDSLEALYVVDTLRNNVRVIEFSSNDM